MSLLIVIAIKMTMIMRVTHFMHLPMACMETMKIGKSEGT